MGCPSPGSAPPRSAPVRGAFVRLGYAPGVRRRGQKAPIAPLLLLQAARENNGGTLENRSARPRKCLDFRHYLFPPLLLFPAITFILTLGFLPGSTDSWACRRADARFCVLNGSSNASPQSFLFRSSQNLAGPRIPAIILISRHYSFPQSFFPPVISASSL